MIKDFKIRLESFYIILPIIIYLFGVSISDYISKVVIGTPYSFNAIFEVISILITLFILNKKGLLKEYGFIVTKSDKILLLTTLLIMPLINLVFGFYINYSISKTILIIITMIGAGFMEEVLFRSHLIRNYQKFSDTYAIVLSSMVFSLLHILNITLGSNIFVTVLQILSSFSLAIMFSLIFINTSSIVLCIISHALINISNVFMKQSLSIIELIVISVIYILICFVTTIYICKRKGKIIRN